MTLDLRLSLQRATFVALHRTVKYAETTRVVFPFKYLSFEVKAEAQGVFSVDPHMAKCWLV
jgi:hypothetical protein